MKERRRNVLIATKRSESGGGNLLRDGNSSCLSQLTVSAPWPSAYDGD